jgi:hypothetical protein
LGERGSNVLTNQHNLPILLIEVSDFQTDLSIGKYPNKSLKPSQTEQQNRSTFSCKNTPPLMVPAIRKQKKALGSRPVREGGEMGRHTLI